MNSLSEKERKQLIKEANKKGISAKDIEAAIETPDKLMSKIVKEFLMRTIQWEGERRGYNSTNPKELEQFVNGNSYKVYKDLLQTVRNINVSDFTGYEVITLDDGPDLLRNIKLQITIVPPEYQFQFSVNTKYVKSILKEIGEYLTKAMYYYQSFIIRHGLLNKLKEFLPLVDISKLSTEKNYTIFLLPECPARIGPLLYYVDKEGMPIIMPSVDFNKSNAQDTNEEGVNEQSAANS